MILVCSTLLPLPSRTGRRRASHSWPFRGHNPPLRWWTPASDRSNPVMPWPMQKTSSTRSNSATLRRLRKTIPGRTNSSPTLPPTPMLGPTTFGKPCSRWKTWGLTTSWASVSTPMRFTSISPPATTALPTRHGTKGPLPANCWSAPTWFCLRITSTLTGTVQTTSLWP